MMTNAGIDLGKWKNLFVADSVDCCRYNGNKCRIPQKSKN